MLLEKPHLPARLVLECQLQAASGTFFSLYFPI